MSEELEERVAELQREVWGLRQMLGQVLLAVGEPVVITAEDLARQLPENSRVVVDNNLEDETFVFYVEVTNEDSE